MFKFIHSADIHLDSPLQRLERYEGAPVQALRQATRKAFENLVDLAVGTRVDFLLIAGDLYDGDWKDYNTGLFFVSQMSRLRESDIPVFIVSGNHDAASKITKTLRLPEGIRLLSDDRPETVRLERLRVAIHGQGFASPAVKKDLAAGYPPALGGYFNIGMLHTCATGREGHEPYAPCTMATLLAKDYDYWALGHVHRREILHENPMIVFPGNIQGRHIRETGPKGCSLVTVDDSGRVAAEFRPLDVIRWQRAEIDVTGAHSGYDVLDRTIGGLDAISADHGTQPMIVRIEVRGASVAHTELSADPEHWQNEMRSAAIDSGAGRIWIEKIKLRTHKPSRPDPLHHSDGPVGELLGLIQELESDPAALEVLGEPLGDIIKRLPRELRTGEDAIAPENPQWLAGALDQVRSMLLRRLLAKADDT